MNKRLTTIFMTLLLFVLGATGAWAQSMNYQNSYSTNFLNSNMFGGSSDGNYVGIKNNVLIGGETYPIVLAIQNNIRVPYTIKFMVPKGTRYLYLHGLGSADTLSVKVFIGTATKPIATRKFLFNKDDFITENGTISFKGTKAKNYYVEPIDFRIPLPANTVITLESPIRSSGFAVYGVYYEDGYSPHKGTMNNPFTAGEAYAIANDYIKLTGQKYVKGLISTTPDIITTGSPRTATFSISDDATHTNEIAVSGCYSFNGGEFTYENDLLPRDKVMLRGNILPKPNAGLASVGNNVPTLISQIHPTYEALVVNESTGSATVMTNHYDSDNPFDWPIHDYNVGHLDASESNYFSFREYYSDDPENMKTLFAANPNGESGYHVVSWETMDNISLTDASNGRLMRVDTDGDHYSLTINQVADGPKLTVSGFETPRFYLYDGSTANLLKELVLDTSDNLFKANNVPMQNGQQFWISKGLNGPNATVYGSASNDYEIINAGNCSDVPVKKDGYNFKMGATGTFNFEFFIADDGSGRADLDVSPAVGKWPRNLSLCKNYDTVGNFVYDPEADTYSAPLKLEVGEEDSDVFWVNGDDGTFFGLSNIDNRILVNRFNSTSIPTQAGNDGDYTSLLKAAVPGDVILKMKLSDDGQNATLTIEWPEPIFKIQTQNVDVTFTKDADGDSYSAELTVTSSMMNTNGFFAFDIIDASSYEWAYYGMPQSYNQGLTFLNSQNIPLGSGKEGCTNIKLPEGTFTLTISPDGKLTVDGWPIISNGDCEGTSVSNFWMKEVIDGVSTGIVPARIVEGKGVDNSRGIVVYSNDNPANAWDTEFFIYLSEALPEGTKYRISFDGKAEQNATALAQLHGEPGSYISWDAFGNVDFTNQWHHYEFEGKSSSDNMQTFAFNLAVTTVANTYYFDNIAIEIVPVQMIDIVKNGDIEGADMGCFKKIEQVGDHPRELVTANFTEGVGKNGSRGIVVTTSADASNTWDTQFFVRLPQTLPEGTKYRISFDVKAEEEATIETQVAGEPGEYIHYVGIGNVNVTDKWQHITREGTISVQQAQNTNYGFLMRTFTFNLNQNKDEVNHFYFDNIKVEIDEAHVVLMGDVNGDGTVTIQDVVLVVDYALKKPVSGFVLEAADVTGDGQVDVSDVVGIVNIVLKKN